MLNHDVYGQGFPKRVKVFQGVPRLGHQKSLSLSIKKPKLNFLNSLKEMKKLAINSSKGSGKH
jgi:hypothetical protein